MLDLEQQTGDGKMKFLIIAIWIFGILCIQSMRKLAPRNSWYPFYALLVLLIITSYLLSV